jgi:trehalose/maltose hydrolase-like predicted phosphorylase
MSHEFPESGIAGSSFLYAFIGLEPKSDGLHIDPKMPSGMEYVGAKNINYRGMQLDFRITHDTIEITCTKNENKPDRYYVVEGRRAAIPDGHITY